MVDVLSRETYAELLNSDFTIHFGEEGDTIAARLTEISPLVRRGSSSSFSLVFLTEPLAGAVQDLYSVEHPETGRFELFLVPVGQTPDGSIQMEAIVNRTDQDGGA